MRVEDFTGGREMMVWGEEFEKFGKTITKGRVVEITAKVEQDSRTDSLQLVAQAIRTLEAPAGGSVRKKNGNGQPALRPLVLRLDSARIPWRTCARFMDRSLQSRPGSRPAHGPHQWPTRRLTTAATVDAANGAMVALQPWVQPS